MLFSIVKDPTTSADELNHDLQTISDYLPIKTLDLMYKLLVRPHLDYCDILYNVPSSTNGSLNSLMEKVEKIQYQAGLAITGAWQGSKIGISFMKP